MEIQQDIVTPLMDWYDEHKRILPWRKDANPYRVWVSEIMLQQTRVEAVKPYFDRFMQALPTVGDLAQAEEEQLLKLWEGLGYYNRVRNMQKAAWIIMNTYDGRFPEDYDLLLQLPGIGSYTAGAVASISFGKQVPAVDGNVLRILSRLLLYDKDVLSQKAKTEAAKALQSQMPAERSGDFNQALMELGATVCVPNGAPHCEACPWQSMCQAHKNECWQEYPKKSTKKPRRKEQRTVLIIGDGKRIVLRKRPDKGLLAGLYELPSLDGHVSEKKVIEHVREIGFSPLRIQKLTDAKHIFSHIEWHMQGYALLTEPFEWNEAPEQGNDLTDDSAQIRIGTEQSKKNVMVTKEDTKNAYPIPSAFAAYTAYLDIHPGIGKEI